MTDALKGGGGGMADLSSENNPDALEMVNDTTVSLDNVLEHVSALYMDNRYRPTKMNIYLVSCFLAIIITEAFFVKLLHLK